ncbi:MAG: hypothetical protein HYY40_14695 [Bacteroidetes bacterium]|nr:hypothetical protein [Bacteroidota bacterium]
METGLSLLGAGITLAAFIFAWIWHHVNSTNNKVIKELSTETRNLIAVSSAETKNLIAEEGRLARESTERIGEKISQMIHDLGQLIVADGEKTRSVNARIAELIAADGERTREIIREIKKG